jgi:hypothetical protein
LESNNNLWWGEKELNLRPIGYEPTALTTELPPHVRSDFQLSQVRLTNLALTQQGRVYQFLAGKWMLIGRRGRHLRLGHLRYSCY